MDILDATQTVIYHATGKKLKQNVHLYTIFMTVQNNFGHKKENRTYKG